MRSERSADMGAARPPHDATRIRAEVLREIDHSLYALEARFGLDRQTAERYIREVVFERLNHDTTKETS